MKCDYCGSSLEVSKFGYKGKTSEGKRKRKTLRFCLCCQAYGVASTQEKVYELWGEVVDQDSIVAMDGSEMCAY